MDETQVQESRLYFALWGAGLCSLRRSRPGRVCQLHKCMDIATAASVPVHVRGNIWFSVSHVDFNCEFGTCGLKIPTLIII